MRLSIVALATASGLLPRLKLKVEGLTDTRSRMPNAV
jgi:hypothetical protein